MVKETVEDMSTADSNSKSIKRPSLFKESVEFLLEFYAKRIRRLAPAAIVVLLSVMGALVIFLPNDYYTQMLTARQVIASALFMQNWALESDAVDYLAQNNSATAVQHFWSLSVEEQFYMFWPILILVTVLIVSKVYSRKKKNI